MIAKFRSTAILNFLLVAIAVTTIAASLWPRGDQRQRVTIRSADGATVVVDLAVNDPHLRSIRNRIILWGRPSPTAELGFARWKRETARHYADLNLSQSDASSVDDEIGVAFARRPATVAEGNHNAVIENNAVRAGENVLQVKFTDQNAGESRIVAGNAAVQSVPPADLATQLADMITGSENRLAPAIDIIGRPAEQVWIAESRLADAAAIRARNRMLAVAAAAGPVPFTIGPLVDGPVSSLGKILSLLLGLTAACGIAEWAHRVPPIRLADVDDDRRQTYGVKTESARVELPAHWVRVIQPCQVRSRRAVIAGMIATALVCSLI